MLTIDAGIGTIEYKEPTNLKLKCLMEVLGDNITTSNPDDVTDYLEKFHERDSSKDIEELQDEIDELKEEKEGLEDKLEELEDAEFEGEYTIDCGIGNIEYTADNLQLEMLMDALKDAIQSSNPFEVLQMLQKHNQEKLAA